MCLKYVVHYPRICIHKGMGTNTLLAWGLTFQSAALSALLLSYLGSF